MTVAAHSRKFWIVTCPNRGCLKTARVVPEEKHAVCPHCGNRWEWRAKRVLRAGAKRVLRAREVRA